jgi:hypothetical protein
MEAEQTIYTEAKALLVEMKKMWGKARRNWYDFHAR